MNKKLLLSILLVIFVMQGYSRDIYMYNGTNVVQTIPNIRKITFSDKTMCVEQSKGTVTSVNLSDFNNFLSLKGITLMQLTQLCQEARHVVLMARRLLYVMLNVSMFFLCKASN